MEYIFLSMYSSDAHKLQEEESYLYPHCMNNFNIPILFILYSLIVKTW